MDIIANLLSLKTVDDVFLASYKALHQVGEVAMQL